MRGRVVERSALLQVIMIKGRKKDREMERKRQMK
jgi:hypothetical protein